MTEVPPVQPVLASPATLLDIYGRQMEINAELAVIREQLKVIYARQMEINTQLAVLGEQVKDIPDHEQRVRRLEASRAKLIGAAVAVSAIVSALGTWLGVILAHH